MKKTNTATRIYTYDENNLIFYDTKGNFRGEKSVLAEFEMRRNSFKEWTTRSGHMLLAEALVMMGLPVSKKSLAYGWVNQDQSAEDMMTWEKLEDRKYEIKFLGLENLKKIFPKDYKKPGREGYNMLEKIILEYGGYETPDFGEYFYKVLQFKAKNDNYEGL